VSATILVVRGSYYFLSADFAQDYLSANSEEEIRPLMKT